MFNKLIDKAKKYSLISLEYVMMVIFFLWVFGIVIGSVFYTPLMFYKSIIGLL